MNIMRILLAMLGMLWIGNAFGASAYYCDPATGRTHSVYTEMCRIKAGDAVEYRHTDFKQGASFSPVEVYLTGDGKWMLAFYVERADINQKEATEIFYRTEGRDSKPKIWGTDFKFDRDIKYAENVAGRRDRATKPLTAADIDILNEMLDAVPANPERGAPKPACVDIGDEITKCLQPGHAKAMRYVLRYANVSTK